MIFSILILAAMGMPSCFLALGIRCYLLVVKVGAGKLLLTV
jgi:hypothetical protein